jgi:hypothetical protein
MPRLHLPFALALLVALAAPAGAQARIVLNRGVDPARIGMTSKQVRAKLGAPDIVESSGTTTSLVYRSRELVFTLLRGRVQIVSTRSRRERTVKGVGPGSTLRAVRKGVPGAHCGAKAGVYVCKTGSSRRGRRSTVFLITDGVVDTVSVALAP